MPNVKEVSLSRRIDNSGWDLVWPRGEEGIGKLSLGDPIKAHQLFWQVVRRLKQEEKVDVWLNLRAPLSSFADFCEIYHKGVVAI